MAVHRNAKCNWRTIGKNIPKQYKTTCKSPLSQLQATKKVDSLTFLSGSYGKAAYCEWKMSCLRFQWGTTSQMINNTVSCYNHALISENLYKKRLIQEITIARLMYLHSKSFLMCQWLPNNFNWLSSYTWAWMLAMKWSLSPPPGELPQRRIWVFSFDTEAWHG